MNNAFPKVPLGEVLTKSDEWIAIKPDEQYRQVTVKLWGKGVVLRDEVSGNEIAANRRLIVKQNQFILSRIDARNGAFGLVPHSLDGAVVSSDFPVFTLNCSRILPEFLDWMSKTHDFVDLCKAASEGTTNRVRLKEERFLATQIPLPSLEEQQRIVARVEELAAKIEEARGLRREAMEERELLISSTLSKFITNDVARTCKLNDICLQITDGEHATPSRIPEYEQSIPLVTAKNVRDGYLDLSTTDFVSDYTAAKCWHRCHPRHEDILMVCVGATTGRVCRLVNPPNIVIVRSVALLRPNKDLIDPKFLEYTLESSDCQNQIWSSVKQAAQPCLYIYRMKQLTIPVPRLEEQHRIVSHLDNLHAKLASLKELQTQTTAELDALMPSILDKAFKGEL